MSIKVGINGFGRMGRLALRESWGCADFEIVHINEMAGDVQSAAHLLRFDSVHGQWDKEVSIKDDALVIDGQRISYSQNQAIADTQWQKADVDLILDCTGAFKSPEALSPYFEQGVSKVVVSAPINNVKLAFKQIKENFINSTHQLDILYRRWDVEENVCRYFIEHYLTVLEKGPPSMLRRYSLKESRNSADYRYVKNNAKTHPIENTVWMNPIRNGISIKSMKWKKIDVTNYDDEDVIVYEGASETESVKLFIGFDTNKIYRVERSWKPNVGKSQSGIWIYKKNAIGKLYLSYHQREWIGARKLPQNVKNVLESNGKKVPDFVPVEFRHELFVVGLKENKKDFDRFNETLERMDMSLYKIPYNDNFWKSFSLPPETNYFKKNKVELESIFKVSLENQFKYSN